MSNKDPDAEFQAVLSQIMKKFPEVIFHPTNEDMFPKPISFSNIEGYPQTKAAFKDFFEIYENKGLTNFKIFVNRISAIRVFAVRVTPIFTNEIDA
jgi:hypothetical protein